MNSEAASTVAEEEDFGEQGQAKLIKSLEVYTSTLSNPTFCHCKKTF